MTARLSPDLYAIIELAENELAEKRPAIADLAIADLGMPI
jgi:hypothetical protein